LSEKRNFFGNRVNETPRKKGKVWLSKIGGPASRGGAGCSAATRNLELALIQIFLIVSAAQFYKIGLVS
jgi:hypothetical protein